MPEFVFFRWGKEVFEPHKDKMRSMVAEEVGDGEFKVSSNGKTYTVNVKRTFEKEYAASCECDYFKHKRKPCKHIVKVMYEAKYKNAFEIPEMEELKEEDIDKLLEETEKAEKGFQTLEERLSGGQVQVLEIPEAAEIDAEQIIAELEGRVVEDYVISIAGKPALSYAGILKVVRMLGGFEVLELEQIERSETLCIYRAKVRDTKSGNVAIAIGKVDLEREKARIEELKAKEPDKSKHKKWDESYRNKVYFMEEIASSFAKRNAFKMLIDEREWAYRLADKLVKRKSK